MKAIREFIIRLFLREKPKGVMTTLPNKDLVDMNIQIIAEKLMRNGIDPNSLKNANQVENAINQIEAPRNVQQGIKSTDSAKVFDMEGKEIPKGSKIMGGKQAETEEEILARINEENKKAVKSLKERKRPDVYTLDDYDTTNMSDIKKEIIKTETKLGNLNPESPDFRQKAKPLIDKIEELKDQMSKIKEDDLPMAQGGRAGFKSGLGPKFLNFLKGLTKEKPFSGKEFVDKRKFIKADEIENKIQMMKNKKFLEETRKEFKKNPPFKFPEPGDKEYDEGLARIQRALIEDRKLNADGGRAGYKFGIGPLFNFLNKKSPMKAYTDYLESVKKRMKAGKEAEVAGEVIPIAAGGALLTNQLKKKLKAMNEEQKKELRKDMEKKADGGRIGLKKGMDRRTFLKIAGGLAALPIVGKFFKGSKVASTAAPVAKEIIKQSSTPPQYFFELANTIKKFGQPDKVTYSDRVEIHRMVSKDGKSELQLTEDLSTGSMQIKKIKPEEDMINEDIVLEFRKGDVDVDPEAGTAFKEADEYTEGREVTQRVYKDDYNEPDFYEGEGIKEIIDEIREAPSIKKAGGGIARMLGE